MYRQFRPFTGSYRSLRRRTFDLFAPHEGGTVGHVVDWAIMALIAANVLAVMFETVDVLSARYATAFLWFERVSVAVFTVEYVGRVWAAVEHRELAGPLLGRLRFASRPLLIVDLLAIAPFYLALVGVGADLRFLRALRLIRLLRLVKIARYSESVSAFGTVLREKKPDLLVALFANSLLLVLASSVMYYAEHQAQPEAFPNIPATLWWGVVTLTTVGYGDVHPITPLGQLFGALTAVLGIGLFALPASILASGFMEATASDHVECPHCGESFEHER